MFHLWKNVKKTRRLAKYLKYLGNTRPKQGFRVIFRILQLCMQTLAELKVQKARWLLNAGDMSWRCRRWETLQTHMMDGFVRNSLRCTRMSTIRSVRVSFFLKAMPQECGVTEPTFWAAAYCRDDRSSVPVQVLKRHSAMMTGPLRPLMTTLFASSIRKLAHCTMTEKETLNTDVDRKGNTC